MGTAVGSRLTAAIGRLTRRLFTRTPSSVTPDAHLAWLEEQVRAYATLQPFASPLNAQDNLTGETWEMREAYRTALREPAVSSALQAKTFAVCSRDVRVLPDDKDDPTHKKAAGWVDWSVSRSSGGWPQLLFNVAFMAQVDGWSVTEKVFDTVDRDHPKYPAWWTLKAARSKDSKFLRLRLDTFKQVVAVQVMNAGQGGVPIHPGEVILFTYLKIFESPFGLSALRPVNRAANLIAAAIKLRSILLENFSGPYLVGKSSDPTARQQFAATLTAARSRGWIVVPEGSEVDVLNLATSAPDQFQQTIEDLRKEIYLAIRGAYLQALESKSPQGDSATHEGQSDLFEWWLAVTLSACLTEQLVPDLVEPHFGRRGGRPVVTLGGIDPGTIQKELDKLWKVNERLPISRGQVYELTGAEPPRGDGDELPPAQPPQPPGGSGGGMGGGLFGDGPSPFADAHEFADDGPRPFTGTIRGRDGHLYHYVNGQRVAAPPAAGGSPGKSAAGGAGKKAGPGGSSGGYGEAGKNHPLAGMSRTAAADRLGDAVVGDEADPLGTAAAGPPKGLDVAAFGAAARELASSHWRDKGHELRLDEAYPTLGKQFGLSKHDFLRAVRALHDDPASGVRLGGWGKQAHELPDPELADVISGRLFAHLNPADKSFADRSGPPGPPPRPGLVWKEETRRWVKAGGGGGPPPGKGPVPPPGQAGQPPPPAPDPSAYPADTDLEVLAIGRGHRNLDAYARETFGPGAAAKAAGEHPEGRTANLAHEYRTNNRQTAAKLRAGQPLDDDERARVDAVNKLAHAAGLPAAMTLHRVVGDGVPDLKPGDTFSDPAPAFVGFDSRRVANIAVTGRRRTLRILADAGAPALYLAGGEGPEAVLPGGARLEVVGVDGDTVTARYRAPGGGAGSPPATFR